MVVIRLYLVYIRKGLEWTDHDDDFIHQPRERKGRERKDGIGEKYILKRAKFPMIVSNKLR